MTTQALILLLVICGIVMSLHPVLVSIFVSLIAGSFGKQHTKPHTFAIAWSYMFALAVVIGLVGFSLSLLFNSLSLQQLAYIGVIIGCIAVTWGLFGVKEYFWYSLNHTPREHIIRLVHDHSMKKNTVGSAMVVGFAAAYTTLFSLFVPLSAIMVICGLLRPLETGWIIYFVIGLLAPLLIIIIAAIGGLKLSALIKWKEENKAVVRLSVGLLNIILGWIIFLLLGGSIGAVL